MYRLSIEAKNTAQLQASPEPFHNYFSIRVKLII